MSDGPCQFFYVRRIGSAASSDDIDSQLCNLLHCPAEIFRVIPINHSVLDPVSITRVGCGIDDHIPQILTLQQSAQMRRSDPAVESHTIDQPAFPCRPEQFTHAHAALCITEHIYRETGHDKSIADRPDPLCHREDPLKIRKSLKPDQTYSCVQVRLCHGLVFFCDIPGFFIVPALFRNRTDISCNIDFRFFSLYPFLLFHRGLCDPAGCGYIFINDGKLFFPCPVRCISAQRLYIRSKAVGPDNVRPRFDIFPVDLADPFGILQVIQFRNARSLSVFFSVVCSHRPVRDQAAGSKYTVKIHMSSLLCKCKIRLHIRLMSE